MKEETGLLNNRWARAIIDLLVKQNVDYFCISPGSRSTPLAIALANHPKANPFVHFDERGAAFHALGYAKATGRPAVIITTSGTAVGNLFPAIMEAHLSHTPLIVITADRPPELRDVSANQTLDQVKIFGNYVRFFVDLPPPTSTISENYLATTIAQAVFMAKGPVHLNCMFREPLFSEKNEETVPSPTLNYESCPQTPQDEMLQKWADNLLSYEKGIILLGELDHSIDKSAIIALSEKLGWPLLPDIFSGLRTDSSAIAHYDLILKSIPDMPLDALLHLGDRYVSKTTYEWIQRAKPKRCFQVFDEPCRSDPAHMITDRLLCSPALFCKELLPYIPQQKLHWLEEWQEYDRKISETLSEYFDKEERLSEPSLFFELQNNVPDNIPLFLANSMPVRDASFFLSQKKWGPILGNRGVSGIDGNIATSVGMAQGLKSPLISVIGDLAGLHDINSLAQMKGAKYPVILIIINNKGGGIFSFLPIAKKQDLLEQFFAASHEFSFESAARIFDLPYHKFQLSEELSTFFKTPIAGSCIIEIETDRQENFHLHQLINQKCLQQFASCTVS